MTNDQVVSFVQWAGLPAAPDTAAGLLQDWEAVEIRSDEGEVVGLGAINGTELHVALAPESRGTGFITRRRCRQWIAPLLERRGFLTTRAVEPSVGTERFLRRLGFERTRSNGEVSHYMLTDLPFEKKGGH